MGLMLPCLPWENADLDLTLFVAWLRVVAAVRPDIAATCSASATINHALLYLLQMLLPTGTLEKVLLLILTDIAESTLAYL